MFFPSLQSLSHPLAPHKHISLAAPHAAAVVSLLLLEPLSGPVIAGQVEMPLGIYPVVIARQVVMPLWMVVPVVIAGQVMPLWIVELVVIAGQVVMGLEMELVVIVGKVLMGLGMVEPAVIAG